MAGKSPRAFYLPDGAGVVSTELTAGPWGPTSQHGGPPAGLLARAMAATPGGEGRTLTKIACEILRPVPVAPLRTQARVIRQGRTIDLLEAVLTSADGVELVTARGWRFPIRELDLPPDLPLGIPRGGSPPAAPEAGEEVPFFPVAHEIGYHTAVSWRFLDGGGWLVPGPATAWIRMDVPLVEGEDPTPMERVLVAADSASGIGCAVNPVEFSFHNVDLSVQLSRSPEGEWIALEAASTYSPTGTGISTARIYDRTGFVGQVTQTLLLSAATSPKTTSPKS